MKPLLKSFTFGLFLGLICLPLQAQTAAGAPTDRNPAVANTAPASQAPREATDKITELVSAGKYAEAQQLTTGLLLAYPHDQRLMQAEALLQKLLAGAGSGKAAAEGAPASQDAPVTSAATTHGEALAGMDKVDYNALIELARQAQQNTDLEQQRASLKQFMDESRTFLQRHPEQVLLWQIRAASALMLNEPDAGYEAGQKLLAMGAADSNDPEMQQLIAQLKIKGWLDQHGVEEANLAIEEGRKYDWILGKWSVAFSYFSHAAFDYGEKHGHNEVEFSKTGESVDGYVTVDGRTFPKPAYRYTVRNSAELTLASNWEISPNPPKWEPIASITFGSDMKTMTIIAKGHTYVFTKQ